MSDGGWLDWLPSDGPISEEPPADDECFAYDVFLACVSGLIARGFEQGEIYHQAKDWAQVIYDTATEDKDFHEVMDQTWPTKDS